MSGKKWLLIGAAVVGVILLKKLFDVGVSPSPSGSKIVVGPGAVTSGVVPARVGDTIVVNGQPQTPDHPEGFAVYGGNVVKQSLLAQWTIVAAGTVKVAWNYGASQVLITAT